jgi:polyisoprenoid-binding protein YceI
MAFTIVNRVSMKGLIFQLIVFFSFIFNSQAVEIKKLYSFSNFELAQKDSNQLKFTIESTKVGLFSSDVDGYALKFSARAQINNEVLSNMEIKIPSASLNTDSDSRDEKLHDHCLSIKRYPDIKIQLKGTYDLSKGGAKTLPGTVFIRGNERVVNVELESSSNGDFIMVQAKSVWMFSKMNIPDPSIAIAKVSDEIKINVKLQLPLKK